MWKMLVCILFLEREGSTADVSVDTPVNCPLIRAGIQSFKELIIWKNLRRMRRFSIDFVIWMLKTIEPSRNVFVRGS